MEENKEIIETEEVENQGGAKTFDDILKEKEYQSEFDKRISKALETARGKWEKEYELKKTEAEKLAKMDAEEKAKYELEKERQEKEKYIAKLNAYELEKEAYKIASDKGVPTELLKVINYHTTKAEDLKDLIDELEVAYKKSVEQGINEKLKEKTPKTVLGTQKTERKSRASY